MRRDDGSVIRVIAGEIADVLGPVREIAVQPTYRDVHLAAGARFAQPIPRGHTAFAYVYRGAGCLGLDRAGSGASIVGPTFAVLSDRDAFDAEAGPAGACFLLVSSVPTREPIARYGPFVMNSRAEILQAPNDLNRDTFVWRKGRA